MEQYISTFLKIDRLEEAQTEIMQRIDSLNDGDEKDFFMVLYMHNDHEILEHMQECC